MQCASKAAIFTVSLMITCAFSSFAPAQQEQKQRQNSAPRRTPPPEAFTACEGKNIGDRSEFIGKLGRTVSGTCESGSDERLVLLPDHLKKQRMGRPPAAYTACEGKIAGDPAQLVTAEGRTVHGICVQEGDRFFLRLSPPGRENQAGPQMKEGEQNREQSPRGSDTPERQNENMQQNLPQNQDITQQKQHRKESEKKQDRKEKKKEKEKEPESEPEGIIAKLKKILRDLLELLLDLL